MIFSANSAENWILIRKEKLFPYFIPFTKFTQNYRIITFLENTGENISEQWVRQRFL